MTIKALRNSPPILFSDSNIEIRNSQCKIECYYLLMTNLHTNHLNYPISFQGTLDNLDQSLLEKGQSQAYENL